VAGHLVDRYDRKGLMILMDLVRAGLIGAVPFLLNSSFLVILVIALLVSTATVLFNPARQAALPDIVPFDLLQPSNAAMQFAERTTEILGYGAAGLLILLGGVPLLFAIDALTFVVSAGLLLTIRFPEVIPAASLAGKWREMRSDIAAGLNVIRQSAELQVIFVLGFSMAAAASSLMPLMVPLAIDKLHAGNAGFALLEASIAVGATFGAIFASYMQDIRRGQLMILGALGMGIFTAFAGVSPVLVLTTIFFIAAGVANMMYLIPMITAIQEVTETETRGRVFAARFTSVQLGVLIGIAYASLSTSVLGSRGSVGTAVLGAGLLMILVSISAGFSSALRKV
jgi:MFS family permease